MRSLHAFVLQHVAYEGPGAIEPWLHGRGHRVTRRRLFAGDPPPEPEEGDLLVVMGGPMGALDDREHRWLAEERHAIAAWIKAGRPVIGICLGAQLIASALGARVYPARHAERGWAPVRWLSPSVSGDPWGFLPGGRSTVVLHWHADTFDLPRGAILRASTDACDNQVFTVGDRVIGLQCHIEDDAGTAAALAATMRRKTDRIAVERGRLHLAGYGAPLLRSILDHLESMVG